VLLLTPLRNKRRAQLSAVTFQLFIAPKPDFGSVIPHSLIMWQSMLRTIEGEVILLLNKPGDILTATRAGFRTEHVLESPNGFPLLDSVLSVIYRHSESLMVGFCNSDLLPDTQFAEKILQVSKLNTSRLHGRTTDSELKLSSSDAFLQGWLLVLSRTDFENDPHDGHVFMDGGVDMWIWNNIAGENNIFGIEAQIPSFCLGRPWFDNWLTATAMQVGGRHVIDGTNELTVYHKNHKRLGYLADWTNVSALENDLEWKANKQLAATQICSAEHRCSSYRLGIGTTCEAPFVLFSTRREGEVRLQVLQRQVISPCPSCNDCYS
jgi:hypothetical protein